MPWEHRQERSFFNAFIETLSMVLTRPAEAFSVMKREGGLGEPLLYALIGGSVGGIVSAGRGKSGAEVTAGAGSGADGAWLLIGGALKLGALEIPSIVRPPRVICVSRLPKRGLGVLKKPGG